MRIVRGDRVRSHDRPGKLGTVVGFDGAAYEIAMDEPRVVWGQESWRTFWMDGDFDVLPSAVRGRDGRLRAGYDPEQALASVLPAIGFADADWYARQGGGEHNPFGINVEGLLDEFLANL